MSKYSGEFKLEVVKYCIDKNHSSYDATKYFGLPNPSPIKKWIRKFREHGLEGLVKNQKSSYSGEFKYA